MQSEDVSFTREKKRGEKSGLFHLLLALSFDESL